MTMHPKRRESIDKILHIRKFGRLTVKEFSKIDEDNNVIFKCDCECGKQDIEVKGNSIKSGTKSCGCLRSDSIKKNRLGKDRCAEFILKKCKSISVQRDIPCDITYQDIKDLIYKKCHYCGSKPSSVFGHYIYNNKIIRYNSVDRLDNTTGFVSHNTVPCCWSCAKMKGELGGDMFYKKCKQIVINLEKNGIID
jgi:hypothetical protein